MLQFVSEDGGGGLRSLQREILIDIVCQSDPLSGVLTMGEAIGMSGE